MEEKYALPFQYLVEGLDSDYKGAPLRARFGERTAIVNGLAAALLGVCATELSQPITCLSSDPAASPERIAGNTVLEITGSRIGMASYFSRLDALLQRPEFAQAAGKAPGLNSTVPFKGM